MLILAGRRNRCLEIVVDLRIFFLTGLLFANPILANPPLFPGAAPEYRAWVAAELPGAPEGLATDAEGHVYAAVAATGEVVRLDGHGGYRHVATVPDARLARVGRTWGLEFDRAGYLYAAYVWNYQESDEMDPLHPACRDSRDIYTGIYRVNVASGEVVPWLTKRSGWPVCFPDDIAIDPAGNVYVTDLTLSGIWKVFPNRKFVLWSSDPLLQWPPAPFYAAPEGANDLALAPDGKSLLVVTDGAPAIVRIPITVDGSAGKGRIVADGLSPLDGVALDERGNIYISEILRSEISVFSPDGQTRITIATAETAPLVNPTSLTFRAGVLCAANLGWHQRVEPRTVVCLSGFRRPTVRANGS